MEREEVATEGLRGLVIISRRPRGPPRSRTNQVSSVFLPNLGHQPPFACALKPLELVNVSDRMDEKRAKTSVTGSLLAFSTKTWYTTLRYRLEALSTFIDSQRALLAQTQSDIERLTILRRDVTSTSPESCSFDYFSGQVHYLCKDPRQL